MKYGKKQNIILFGKYNKKLPIYKFFENAYVQLNEENSLTSIVITDFVCDKNES